VFSPHTEVLAPPGLRPLSSYKVANSYREFVTDADQPAKLRKRFESYKKQTSDSNDGASMSWRGLASQ
jgi:hypothetical protein